LAQIILAAGGRALRGRGRRDERQDEGDEEREREERRGESTHGRVSCRGSGARDPGVPRTRGELSAADAIRCYVQYEPALAGVLASSGGARPAREPRAPRPTEAPRNRGPRGAARSCRASSRARTCC